MTKEEYEQMLQRDCEHIVDVEPLYDHTWEVRDDE